MLLTRLAEHASRIDRLPPPFYRVRNVRWAIRIHADGTPASATLADRSASSTPAGEPMAVPYIYRSGIRPPAVLLVDDLRYVTAFQPDDSGPKRHDTGRRNGDYIALLNRWRDSAPADPAATAVLAFFENGHHRRLEIPEGAKPTDVAAIMVDGQWAHERESAVSFWGNVARERKASANAGICLVCGQPGTLLGTIPEAVKAGAIPAASGRARDAQLASVNKPAQGRGGKLQLATAPVCDRCGSAAMSALNALLADKSHRYRTADSVLTWWLRETDPFPWIDWINEPEPGQVAKLIGELRQPHQEPAIGGVDSNAFYAVTLSANQSRAVVRDWLEIPLGDVQMHLGRWFADHQVTDLWRDGLQVVPLWLLSNSAGRWGTDNGQARYLGAGIPHGCNRDLLLTALRGSRPPAYLLAHVLRRIRADGRVDLPRAALLRLILVRSQDTPKENYMAGLNPDIPSPPYQCGRMFAVLEQIQRAALGRDINTTIADKYLSAAMATPRAILIMLRKNAAGHMKRLRRSNAGAYHALGDRLDEVLGHLGPEPGIPRALDLTGQSQFILGYHHQRAADLAATRARADQRQTESREPGATE
jgi:CRISPR-associated protein Csd1